VRALLINVKREFTAARANPYVFSGSMKQIVSLFLVGASILGAQTLSFGVKGGGFFTEPAERLDQSRKYVVGPFVELGFGSRVAVEGNALYSRFGTAAGIRAHSAEFPVLGKYYFADRESSVRPWLSSGFAFRNIWFDEGRGNRRLNSTEPAVGAVFGAGASFKTWIFRLTPEVRYTRWGGYNFPATNPHQVQALVGIGF
jgi:hypothetical protein